ncbi:MAG: HAD hydrolase-like protein [Cyclobacteriaceae bacterium]
MNLDNIKIAVFDMAGTTIDEGHTVYQSVAEALAEVGIDISVEEVFQQIGGMNKVDGIQQLINKAKPDNQDVFKITIDAFLRILGEKYTQPGVVKEMEGASLLFAQLQEKGIIVALDTGYTRDIAQMLLEIVGWNEQSLVDFMIASEEVESGRPSPLMIHKIMDQFDVSDPSEVIKIGDTKADIEEGINANCRYIVGVASSSYSAADLLGFGATHVVGNLTEMLEQVNLSAS